MWNLKKSIVYSDPETSLLQHVLNRCNATKVLKACLFLLSTPQVSGIKSHTSFTLNITNWTSWILLWKHWILYDKCLKFHKENHKRTHPHAVLIGYDFAAPHSIFGFGMGKLLILSRLVRTLWNCWDLRNITATWKSQSVNSSKWQNLLTIKNTYKLLLVIRTYESALLIHWFETKESSKIHNSVLRLCVPDLYYLFITFNVLLVQF